MVPLTPPSVLFHENVTGSLLGETEPVPVPIVVQALSATAAHSSAGAAVNRLEVLMIQFLLFGNGKHHHGRRRFRRDFASGPHPFRS
jgi:hypothetical protein